MSEKDPILSLEELTTIYGCWWNTSAGLSARIPEIVQNEEWTKFSTIYDEPQFQEIRVKAWADASQDFYLVPSLFALRDLAERALGRNSDLNQQKALTPEVAGKRLAKIILDMLAPNKNKAPKEFADSILESIKCESPPQRNAADLVWAMVQFMEREKRLPKKKELNIEASRIRGLIRLPMQKSESYNFGKVYLANSLHKEDKLIEYRVYSVVTDEEDECVWVCKKADWDKLRWNDKKEFSLCLSRFGLAGLGVFKRHPNDKKSKKG